MVYEIAVVGGGPAGAAAALFGAAGTVADVSVLAIVTAGDGARVTIDLISELNGSRWVDNEVMKA